MTMMSMTLMLGGISMVIKVFQQCFNATMGVMLRLPIIFTLFAYAFPMYCNRSTV